MTRPIGTGAVPSAAQIPSDGPSTVQDDIDALKYIESLEDLERRFPAVAGVHTIDKGSEWRATGTATIDIGINTIVGVFPGGITFVGGRGTIQTAANAPLISGEIALTNVTALNVNAAGPTALCVDVESLAGRSLVWDGVTLVGQRPGRITNVVGFGDITGLAVVPLAPGAFPLELGGTLGTIVFTKPTVRAPGTVPYTGFEIPATASVGSVLFDTPALLGSPAGDSFVRVDPGATIPFPTAVSATGGAVVDGGNLWDPTGLTEVDEEIVSWQNLNSETMQWLGDVALDTAGLAPVTLTMSGTPETIPTENVGATAVAQAIHSERFALNIDAVQDFQVIAGGRTDRIQGEVSWRATVRRNGGSLRSLFGWIQYRTSSAGLWTTILESKGETPMGVTYDNVGGSAPFTWDVEYEFRIAIQGLVGTNTDIQDWRIQLGRGSL